MVERMHKISLNDKAFYLFSNKSQDDNLSSFTITNGDEVYLGEVSMQDIQGMASEVDMSIDKYHALIKESFGYKSRSRDLGKFAYLLHGDDESYKFIIKQELEGGILFQLGSIAVHKQETSSGRVIEIFDHLQDQLKSLQTEVSNFKSLSKSLEADKKDMCKRLEEYTSIKNSLEQDLYTKFSLVLNEKKARIRELKTQLESRDSGSPIKTTQPDKGDERSDTDEGMDTDEEKGSLTKKSSDLGGPPVPSSPDFILDEEIADDDDKPRKNRKRIRASKPKTPVIPRTTSLPRPQRQASEGSTKSTIKKKKSKEMTEDELLDEL